MRACRRPGYDNPGRINILFAQIVDSGIEAQAYIFNLAWILIFGRQSVSQGNHPVSFPGHTLSDKIEETRAAGIPTSSMYPEDDLSVPNSARLVIQKILLINFEYKKQPARKNQRPSDIFLYNGTPRKKDCRQYCSNSGKK